MKKHHSNPRAPRSMKISSLKPGQSLWDLHRYKMGNTTMKSWGVWPVHVVSVAEDGESFTASWNSNPPKKYYRVPSNWKAKEPVMVAAGGLGKRPATRAEIKEMALKKGAQP